MKVQSLLQNKINHIVLLIDASTSMRSKESQVVQVVDNQVTYLAKRSKDLDQETRVTVYLFADRTNIRCIIYDKDVLRLPSLEGLYKAEGNTALIDAQLKAIADLKQTPEQYGDHAFLIFAVTDGEENNSIAKEHTLRATIDALPENYTIAVLVPNSRGVHEAKSAGYPADNIAVWDTSRGFDEAGSIIRESTETFMSGRTRGVRGTKSLFKVVNVDVSSTQIRSVLNQLASSSFVILKVARDSTVRDFVEFRTGVTYQIGAAYYELTKTEEVQDYKKIAIRDRNTGAVYIGPEARQLLGIPDTFIKLKPGDFNKWQIFIESTSVNRKLLGGTDALVLTPHGLLAVKAKYSKQNVF